MFRIFLIVSSIFLSLQAFSQYKVHLVVNQLPSYTKADDTLYIAGSFNGWNPRRTPLVLLNGRRGITIELSKGMFQYKITRGSWETVESGEGGQAVSNRELIVEGPDTVSIDVQHWADHFPKLPRQSTASPRVSVLDSAFYIPQLGRHRRIWIYLPWSYATSGQHYPVLYMHDGQNLFDEATAGFGEWGVDEALDTLGAEYGEAIVIGIDHGGERRINEYSPCYMPSHGNGEGKAYVDFLVQTLKPYIDGNYRTKRDAEHTFIAGSSMGGLISFYAAVNHPKVFGGAGVFSPAFWIAPDLMTVPAHAARKVKGQIYFYAGGKESETMVSDMLHVFRQMQEHSRARMETVVRSEGRHDEPTWRSEFPLFYRWMMGK